ncbi:MAG: histidine kinase N-terminal 7TM domain-containing protein [Patescibacteria group bacterium]|jgi:hypothetical protein
MIDQPYFAIAAMIIIGLFDFGFASFIFTRYQRESRIIMYGMFALMVGGWVLLNGVGLLFERGGATSDFFGRSAFVFAAFIFPFMYVFSVLFPFPSARIDGRFVFLALLPAILLSALAYFTDALIQGFDLTRYAQTIPGEGFWLYVLYILIFFGLILAELLGKFRRSDGIHRWQLKYLIIVIALSGFIGIITVLILPYIWYFDSLAWIGPCSSIIWLGGSMYIVMKR